MTYPTIDSASLGKVALFYQQNALRFAYITEIDGNSLHLTGTEGEGYTLVSARLLLVSRDLRAQNPESLKSYIQQAFEHSKTLEALPLSGETFAEICQKYHFEMDIARFALYLQLKNQPLIYQQKHDRFYRLSALEVEERQARQFAQNKRQEWLSRVDGFIWQKAELTEEDARNLRQELRQYLQGQKIEDLEKVLKNAATGNPQKLAIELRRRLGDTSLDPILAASGLPILFEGDYPLASVAWEDLPLADYGAFCIDDEDSLDYDDAISLQAQGNGFRLGIHISLLALQIAPESTLFDEALNRVSSLYLPPESLPMLPPCYSQAHFSLQKGMQMPVLSQYFYLSEAYDIEVHEIKIERINILSNYSYPEVARLASSAPFATLIQIANACKEARGNNDEKPPYYQVYVKAAQVQMRRIDPQSAGRMLIEELMILYNANLAAYCARHKLPLIYRNINQFYDEKTDFSSSSAYLDTRAEYHPGIGVGAYLHASSPIRRVVDLINQMQIVSHLQKGDLCFSEDTLKEMIPTIEKRNLQIKEILQQSERYWFLRYIEQNELHNPLKAWHRGFVNGKIKVEIMPWGKTVLLINEAMPQEASFHVVVYEVDWERGCLVGDLIE